MMSASARICVAVEVKETSVIAAPRRAAHVHVSREIVTNHVVKVDFRLTDQSQVTSAVA